jgi:hypothetical protein
MEALACCNVRFWIEEDGDLAILSRRLVVPSSQNIRPPGCETRYLWRRSVRTSKRSYRIDKLHFLAFVCFSEAIFSVDCHCISFATLSEREDSTNLLVLVHSSFL